MKFSEHPFTVDKRYAKDLARKTEVFRRVTSTRKATFVTLVTLGSLRDNQHKRDAVHASVDAATFLR